MLWLLLGLVAVGAFIWWVNRDTKLDSNDDGKVDTTEAKAALDTAILAAAKALDANKDGKVDVADVKEVGKKVKAGAKKAAGKAKDAAKKVKKPKLTVAK